MKVLLGTDLALSYIEKDENFEAIVLLLWWLRILNIFQCLHFVSYTALYDMGVLKKMDQCLFPMLRSIKPKSLRMREVEETFLCKFIRNATEKKAIQSILAQLDSLIVGDVEFLITNEPEMHHLARLLQIDEQVYTVENFIEKCSVENRNLDPTKGCVVKLCPFGDLDIEDSFFDSFKQDYGSYFEKWFRLKNADIVYVAIDEKNKIKALLKLKLEDEHEDYSDIHPYFPPMKRLKISSLKVGVTGSKLGERFLKIIFDEALRFQVEEIYATIYINRHDKERLMQMMATWGFKIVGKKTDGELVIAKPFKKAIYGNLQESYPFHKLSNNAFIIPIHQKYAEALLPSTIVCLNGQDYEPYKNNLKKVLILKRTCMSLMYGSLLLFYQKSHILSNQAIIAVGVVEHVYDNIQSEKEFVLRCRKRSLFDDIRLRECWNMNKTERPIVVEFLYSHFFYDSPITKQQLENNGINTSLLHSQQPYLISKEAYSNIIKDSQYEKDIFIS